MRKKDLDYWESLGDYESIRDEIAELESHIIRCDKEKVPDHKYIKTVVIGKKKGHIYSGYGRYWLCLRKNNTVSYHDHNGLIFGFSRKSLNEIELFANELNIKDKTMQFDSVVNPVILSGSPSWPINHRDTGMINIKSGIVFPMCMPKKNLMSVFGLTDHSVLCISKQGLIAKDFVLHHPRHDGVSWEKIIGKPIRYATIATQPHWGTLLSDGTPLLYKNIVLRCGNATIQVSKSSDISGIICVEPGLLSRFLQEGGDGLIGGWKLDLVAQ